jgi:hypothetical protein
MFYMFGIIYSDAWGTVQGGCVIGIARVEYGSLEKGLGDVA